MYNGRMQKGYSHNGYGSFYAAGSISSNLITSGEYIRDFGVNGGYQKLYVRWSSKSDLSDYYYYSKYKYKIRAVMNNKTYEFECPRQPNYVVNQFSKDMLNLTAGAKIQLQFIKL